MYRDIYSALYNWNLTRWSGDNVMASFMTAAGLAGAMTMNTALVVGIIVAILGPVHSVPKWAFFLVPLVYLLLNYIAFVRHSRYVEFVRRFQTKSSTEQRRVTFVAWSYVIASYGFPLAYAFGMVTISWR